MSIKADGQDKVEWIITEFMSESKSNQAVQMNPIWNQLTGR